MHEKTRPDLETIVYIRHMLGELRFMAEGERCLMLRYLIELAHSEAGDIQRGRPPSDIRIEQPRGPAV